MADVRSWPAALTTRIELAIREQVEAGNVGLAASIAAQVAATYYAPAAPREPSPAGPWMITTWQDEPQDGGKRHWAVYGAGHPLPFESEAEAIAVRDALNRVAAGAERGTTEP